MCNVVFVLCGVTFCFWSLLDFIGFDKMLLVEYRELPGRKRWQRRKSLMEGVIGVGAIFFLVFEQYQIISGFIGIIVLITFVLLIFNNKNYIKQMKRE